MRERAGRCLCSSNMSLYYLYWFQSKYLHTYIFINVRCLVQKDCIERLLRYKCLRKYFCYLSINVLGTFLLVSSRLVSVVFIFVSSSPVTWIIHERHPFWLLLRVTKKLLCFSPQLMNKFTKKNNRWIFFFWYVLWYVFFSLKKFSIRTFFSNLKLNNVENIYSMYANFSAENSFLLFLEKTWSSVQPI